MILATLLLIITGILVLIALLLLGIGGSLFTFLFADVIVCIAIIWVLFFRKKKNKKK